MGCCLSRGVVAPNKVLPEFGEEKEYLGQHGFAKNMKSKNGADLFAYFWPAHPDVPLKGVVQLSHGNATYTCFDFLKHKGPGQGPLYEGSWVAALNAAGFSVGAADHAGHGRSRDRKSLAAAAAAPSFQTHVDNLLALADFVVASGGAAFPSSLPYFLMGNHMGGLAAAMACVRQPGRFAGLVLLSPLLSLEGCKEDSSSRPPNKVSRPEPEGEEGGARGSGSGSRSSSAPSEGEPKAAAAAGTEGGRPGPSWIYEAWAADPYVQHEVLSSPPAAAARAVEGLLAAIQELMGTAQGGAGAGSESKSGGDGGAGAGEGEGGTAAADAAAGTSKAAVEEGAAASSGGGGGGGLVVPLLVFQSSRDTQVDPEGARRLVELAAARRGSSDKTLRLLSDPWHFLTLEPGWETLLSETTAWLSHQTVHSTAFTKPQLIEAKEGEGTSATAPGVAPAAASGAVETVVEAVASAGGSDGDRKQKGEEEEVKTSPSGSPQQEQDDAVLPGSLPPTAESKPKAAAVAAGGGDAANLNRAGSWPPGDPSSKALPCGSKAGLTEDGIPDPRFPPGKSGLGPLEKEGSAMVGRMSPDMGAGKAEKVGETEPDEGEPVTPALTRSQSMLERKKALEAEVRSAEAGPSTVLITRRYSFGGGGEPGGLGRGGRGGDGGSEGASPAQSGVSLLGPLPPLGARRGLEALPMDLSRRLAPLPPLLPLLDRKPIR